LRTHKPSIALIAFANALSELTNEPTPMGSVQVKLLHWLIGISLSIGLLVLLNQLQIPYYLYYPRTTQTILISPSYDYYLFLISTISLPWTFAASWKRFSTPVSIGTVAVWTVSIALAILNQPAAVPILYAAMICAAALNVLRSESRRVAITEILSSTLSIFVLVEWASLFYWVSAALNPQARVGGLSEQLEANLTFFLYPLAIPIMLLLLFSWLWVPLIPRLPRFKSRLLVRYQPSPQKPGPRTIVAALDLFAIIAIIVFFYTYLAGQAWVVGEDTFWRYIQPLNALVGLTPSQAFNTSASHGVYVMFLYLIQSATGISPISIVKYAPLVLAFCTATAVFFAAQRGGWNFQLAILTSISTLLWMPTTLGIYVAIQANWVALLFWMIFLAIYFADSEPRIATYVILAVLSLIILIVHPWTWGVFATTLLLTGVLSRQSPWSRHSARTIVASLILALPVGVAAYALSPSLSSDFLNTIQLYISGPVNPITLLTFGAALANMFATLGPVLSPAILLLCLVGAYVLSRRRGITANYLIAWIVAWCVGSILVAPSGFNYTTPGLGESGLWRMLYVSPLPFLLALGMEKCLSIAKQPITIESSKGILFRVVPLLSMAPFVAAGAGLFMIWDVNVRLVLVAAALIVALFLVVSLPKYRSLDFLIVSVLALLLFNAAFRSLYPLVLDPHNIFTSPGATR
jgi:hypothetical protein